MIKLSYHEFQLIILAAMLSYIDFIIYGHGTQIKYFTFILFIDVERYNQVTPLLSLIKGLKIASFNKMIIKSCLQSLLGRICTDIHLIYFTSMN